jgi:HDOD domain
VLAGIAARLVSDKMRYRFEYDYLCGLLHDIGEARIYRILANYKEAIDPALVEDLVVRYHRRAGAELAIAWGLPEPIIEACARHHDDPAKASNLVKMVMMADILVRMLERRQAAAVAAAPVLEEKTDAPAAVASDDAPGPTDEGAALGPTSAIWPVNLNDPPGAPDPKSATWATREDAPAKEPPLSDPVRPAAAPLAAAESGTSASSEAAACEPALEDEKAADFDRLAALGMARELAEAVLDKLADSTSEMPI